ncbi:hypothetical protein [Phreatobacter sp.]|nr:hypothetical protein [Phreatobacter sp.]
MPAEAAAAQTNGTETLPSGPKPACNVSPFAARTSQVKEAEASDV